MFESGFIITALISLFFAYSLFFYKSKIFKALEVFPSPDHHFILGIVPFFLTTKPADLLKRMGSWAKEYGPIVHLWAPALFPIGPTVIISEGVHAEKVLTSPTNLNKGFAYDVVRPWLGEGLLMSKGPKWTHRRKMLTPAFHFKILEDFIQVFNKESKKMVTILEKEHTKNETTFDICPYVSLCTLDIICETAMGKCMNAQDNRDNEYIKAIYDVSRVMMERSVRPWFMFEPLWRLSSLYREQERLLGVLHGFTTRVIAERKQQMLQERSKGQNPMREEIEDENIYFKSKRRLAFLDLLLQVQLEKGEKELTDTDIREETDTFMFEGHDTTSANISFTIYSIGCNPEVQQKVHKEMDEIFGRDKEREITAEDLTRMKYLECVIKETLRVYPSVPFIQRKLTSDITLNDGRVIPCGTTAGILIYQVHRDPRIFPDPHVFKPERFLPGQSDSEASKKAPFSYIPFSAGPRNCIGQKFAMMEEKVLLATFFRNFKVKSMIEPGNMTLLLELILRPENGLPIVISTR